ncbi:unnamed protein product [Rotaria socialis]|uniref:Uncharacterized protein n=1 Tax=Rotaria socialis TaxID=392032 RepID=A0A817S564_9BILA|nr:unnamed protein product [Rotaria socialis]CAF3422534.1 unnamed protein product [Rotaria socialis]CAF3800681.1 unnamed protein product [Rotaria socialis]CAF4849577.1 unnamed protein product [Rotaria socialis]
MNGHQSKQNTPETKTIPTAHQLASSTVMRHIQRMAKNNWIIWIDDNFDPENEDHKNMLTQLQIITNDLHTFTQCDECIDFLTDVQDRKVCLIVSNIMGQRIVPLIHDTPKLHSIYIYGNCKLSHESWNNNWNKIKGVYEETTPIWNALKTANKQYNQDDISLSFVNVDQAGSIQNLDQLEPSFMYTQLFKEILLSMQHGQQAKDDFIQFWYKNYIGNPTKLKDIAEFGRDYSPEKSIWWYSRDYFLYRTLNWSLRILEAGAIMKMVFFICDLHRTIESLYKQQGNLYNRANFQVFRGQGLSEADFDKLKKNKGGLISFNNFLSTSKDRDVSLVFAEGAIGNCGMVGILFQMSIDPIISSTPFAFIQEHSYLRDEEEILFSMHTVFRIEDIQKLDSKNPIYQVDLKLTSDDDEQLHELTEFIQGDDADKIGWSRLGNLLLKIGQFNKAA